MMLLFKSTLESDMNVLLWALFTSSIVHGLKRSECSSELDKINGPSTCAQTYLEKINSELKLKTQLLFTPDLPDIVDQFAAAYGVEVTVNDALYACSPETCFDFSSLNSTFSWDYIADATLQFDNNLPYTISSASMIIKGSLPVQTGNNYLWLYRRTPDPSFTIKLTQDTDCTGLTGINAFFTDSAPRKYGENCGRINSGGVYRPSDGTFAALSAGQQMTANFGLGVSMRGAGSFNTITLRLCTLDLPPKCQYGRNIARSNLNEPGFRFDSSSQKYYLTTIYREPNTAKMLYVTITAPKTSVYC